MDFIQRIPAFIITLLFSFNAHAISLNNNSTCPPAATVAVSKFIGAMPADTKWGWLLGAPATYNNKDWSIMFAVILPHVKASSVVEKSQVIFNNQIALSDPFKTSISDCTYEKSNTSWVVAYEGALTKTRLIHFAPT